VHLRPIPDGSLVSQLTTAPLGPVWAPVPNLRRLKDRMARGGAELGISLNLRAGAAVRLNMECAGPGVPAFAIPGSIKRNHRAGANPHGYER